MYSMFRSARLKLTLFYLIILLGMSLVLTLSFRVLAEHEYARSSDAQLGQVRHLFIRYPWDTSDPDFADIKPEVAFGNIQDNQQEAVRRKLNHDFVMINVLALVIGGVLSYWFAGRTLRPIEEAHEAQARFAADASHELRTPLASMKVENEVFLRQPAFSEAEAREQIESNLEEVQRLEQLSNNLLALAHYEKVALPTEVFAAREVIQEGMSRVTSLAEARQVVFDIHAAQYKVRGHYDSLAQLMAILLDNAIKYGPYGGTVTIKGAKRGMQYSVEVIDEGPGIAADDLPHIFERLYRGDKARTAQGGYGLGLALAKQIATANRGTLQAFNTKQGGACFELVLELVKS